MAKKALYNFSSNGIRFEQGKVYSDEETKGLDQTNFQDTAEIVEPPKPIEKEVTPPEMDSLI